jgi:hypothetical protein
MLGLLLACPSPGAGRVAPAPRPPPAVEARPVHLPPLGSRTPPVAPGSAGSSGFGPATQGLSIAIQAPGADSDVGVAIPLEANVSGGIPPYEVRWNDSWGGWSSGGYWSLNASAPGTVQVVASVTDAGRDLAVSSLRLSFVEPPTLAVSAVPSAVDAGVPFSLVFTTIGGVPPLEVSWELSDGPANTTQLTASDTPSVVLALVGQAGPVVAVASVTDAVGGRSMVSQTIANAYPRPTLHLGPGPAFADAGSPFELQGLVVGGAPPVVWTVLPSGVVSGPSASSVPIDPNGSFEWSGRFDAPGNTSLLATVTDGAGANASATLPVQVFPPLSVRLVGPGSLVPRDSSVNLTVVVDGGYPPYDWAITFAGEAGPSGSWSATGNATVELPVGNVSDATVIVVITDGVGGSASGSLPVATLLPGEPSPTPSGPAPPGSLLGEAATPVGIALALLTVAALMVPRWRRHKAAAADPTDTLRVVERILHEGDGVDRETLVYRGELEGIDRSEVFGALAELRRSDRLTTREGAEGAELLGLKAPGPGRPAEEGP